MKILSRKLSKIFTCVDNDVKKKYSHNTYVNNDEKYICNNVNEKNVCDDDDNDDGVDDDDDKMLNKENENVNHNQQTAMKIDDDNDKMDDEKRKLNIDHKQSKQTKTNKTTTKTTAITSTAEKPSEKTTEKISKKEKRKKEKEKHKEKIKEKNNDDDKEIKKIVNEKVILTSDEQNNGPLPNDKDEKKDDKEDVTSNHSDENVDDEDYDEIDQIYDYIRGFAPLPERTRLELLKQQQQLKSESKLYHYHPVYHHHHHHHHHLFNKYNHLRPEPPPIETIPNGKHKRLTYPVFIHDIATATTASATTASAAAAAAVAATGRNDKKYEHIYEKIGKNRVYHARVPVRSNSVSIICLPVNSGFIQYNHNFNHNQNINNNKYYQQQQKQLAKQQQQQQQQKAKLFIKSQTGQKVCTTPAGPPTKTGRLFSRNSSKKSKTPPPVTAVTPDIYGEYPPFYAFQVHPHHSSTSSSPALSNPAYHLSTSPTQRHLSAKMMSDKKDTGCRTTMTSPLFNIRYKSLTNLHFIPYNQVDYATASNTLESSNSGGKQSSGSGSGANERIKCDENQNQNYFLYKYPKAKTRKLSRPLSLTNLFWDFSSNSKTSFNNNNTRKTNSNDKINSNNKNIQLYKYSKTNENNNKSNSSNNNIIDMISSTSSNNLINNNNNKINNFYSSVNKNLVYNLNSITEKQRRFSTLYL